MLDRVAPTSRPGPYELFFALMMEREAATQLGWHHSQIRRTHGLVKSTIPADRLHMTLLGAAGGFGTPRPEIVTTALRAAAGLRFPQFEIELDRVESFRHKDDKPLVATETIRNEALLEFQRRLRESVLAAGIPLPRDRFGKPHVTLAWDRAIPEPLRIRPIPMIVREFALVLSHVGQSRYDILGRWGLIPWE